MALKVGFVGLGVQGKYLAINEAQAGFGLMAYDLRPEPLDEVAAAGAKIARSNAEIGRHAEVVQVCVLDDAQVEAVVLGPDGVLDAAAPGTTIVVHSTIRPATIARLAEVCAARQVELVDVPVSGSDTGAKNKAMSFMFGGSDATLAKCRPLFEASGSKIQHTGGLGTGIRAKLAHQLVISVNILAAYEGVGLGLAAGLDPEVLTSVIRDGVAQSRIAERWTTQALKSSSRRVFFKDLQLCLEYGHELGLSLPGAALTQQLLDKLIP